MNKGKIVGFTGAETEDILLYLSVVFVKLGKKAAIIDNTQEGLLRYCLPAMEAGESSMTYREVDYFFGRSLNRLEKQNWDIVLVNSENGKEACDEWYLVADGNRRMLDKLKKIGEAMEGPVNMIIRNTCQYKVNGTFLRQKVRQWDCQIKNIYLMPADLLDYEYYLRIQYEPLQEFKELSQPYRKMLMSVAETVSGAGRKEIEQAYKLAKRGKRLCR